MTDLDALLARALHDPETVTDGDVYDLANELAALRERHTTALAVIRRLKAHWTPWPDHLEWAGFRGSEPMTEAEQAVFEEAKEEAK